MKGSSLDDDLEIIRPDFPRGKSRAVLFDFDGTLSLIRAGWPQIMIPMMVQVLRETGTSETDVELTATVDEFVTRLNGRPTIFQMRHLRDEVARRGGVPRHESVYAECYRDALMTKVRARLTDLAERRASAADWVVPGAHEFLEALRQRGLPLYLASGTDLVYVRQEAEALGLTHFFVDPIEGPVDDSGTFSKAAVIARIVAVHKLGVGELLSFGDGVVETEAVKQVGGVAVAVASDEENRLGVNHCKRDRLVQAGADAVIPDYRHWQRLLPRLIDRA